ncbi:protein-export membrane protein, secD/secF family [Rubidibacter lacunae KORDI 51-2]|uniref:Protein translocase subunit SecD n=1 Tax=Rubidibacter lacunae KORDI 51-2 TaxID=582515 RepID=U5DLS7_9CHRO|nr:protein translocase subunit SecD [Rubidibacter lacunae]ERN40660.1 protein-export membrane protein, secD/secF family [Rubidibacter lacunae KORDI 51-2]
MQRQRLTFGLMLVLAIAAIVVLVNLPLSLGLDLRGGAQLTVQVQPTDEIPNINSDQLDAVKSVLENRVNGLGVAEPVVQTVGEDKIVVQLPGVSDPEQAERVLGGTAQLEFREQLRDTEDAFAQLFSQQRLLLFEIDQLRAADNPDPEAIAEGADALEDANRALLPLFGEALLSGRELRDARAEPLQTGNGWQVTLRFNPQGADAFAELTRNVAGTGRTLGIFLDDVLVSAPSVGAQYADRGITGGSAVISGNFSAQDAQDLAIQLRGGSLPLPVAIVENRTVGSTLGRDSIQRSIYAALAGLLLVLVFMVVYYRLPGAIANVALTIYAVLTLAAYALVGVTLTLPGIAGFILSIGMAVDANVLIFERTREELRAGKTLYRGVESGFYRAFSSILDSNVTTLIACGALFWLGSGLVRGFALTLGIGVAISMFTALTCSRTLMLIAVLGFPSVRRKPELFCPKLSLAAKTAQM